jgi:hypothetical protein
MEYLDIKFTPSTPSGSWYFKGYWEEDRETKGYWMREVEAYPDVRDQDDEDVRCCDYRVDEHPDFDRYAGCIDTAFGLSKK